MGISNIEQGISNDEVENTGINTLPVLRYLPDISLMITGRKYDLEERLINFSVSAIKLSEKFPKSYSGNYLSGQLTRSASSPALQYGEAQSAESRSDFIHKMKIALKELRETNCCLRIVVRLQWIDAGTIDPIVQESNELISIFVKSIFTAGQNRKNNQ
jgi:four helix bundle protein